MVVAVARQLRPRWTQATDLTLLHSPLLQAVPQQTQRPAGGCAAGFSGCAWRAQLLPRLSMAWHPPAGLPAPTPPALRNPRPLMRPPAPPALNRLLQAAPPPRPPEPHSGGTRCACSLLRRLQQVRGRVKRPLLQILERHPAGTSAGLWAVAVAGPWQTASAGHWYGVGCRQPAPAGPPPEI